MSTTLTYRGPAALVSVLAQELKTRGATVTYEPLVERRDVGQAVQQVVVELIVMGPSAVVNAVVGVFVAQWAGRGGVQVDGAPGASIEERLERLEELLSVGTITKPERDAQRERILEEL